MFIFLILNQKNDANTSHRNDDKYKDFFFVFKDENKLISHAEAQRNAMIFVRELTRNLREMILETQHITIICDGIKPLTINLVSQL